MTYLDQPATMTVDDVWAELAGDQARPVVHSAAAGDGPVVHVHLLGDATLAYTGPTVAAALTAALTAWRRAKCAAAVSAGLLDNIDDARTRPADEVALAADAAYAIYEIRVGS